MEQVLGLLRGEPDGKFRLDDRDAPADREIFRSEFLAEPLTQMTRELEYDIPRTHQQDVVTSGEHRVEVRPARIVFQPRIEGLSEERLEPPAEAAKGFEVRGPVDAPGDCRSQRIRVRFEYPEHGQ